MTPHSFTHTMRYRFRRINELLDWPGMPRVQQLAPASATIYCVYRAANARNVEDLISEATRTGAQIALWALDCAAPTLHRYTVDVGPGSKFDLVNQLAARMPGRGEDFVVLADDDVKFVRGDLWRFLLIQQAGSLDIASPAHDRHSKYSHEFTRARPRMTARQTRFVEIGPLVSFSPAAARLALPFPTDAGMGWGLEALWSQFTSLGIRMGIVDAVRMRHLGEVAGDYSRELALDQQRRLEARAGVRDTADLMVELRSVWRPWRRRAPWGQ